MTERELTGGGIPEAAERGRRLMRSGRVRLAALTAALILIAGLAVALLLYDGYRMQRRTSELQLHETATALSLAVDGRVREAVGVLQALSASPELQAGNLAAFDRQAREVARDRRMRITLTDDQGRRLMNTAAAPGAQLPPVPPPIFRNALRELDGRDLWVSGLITDRSMLKSDAAGGFPGPVIRVMIPFRRPGAPTWYLGMGLSPELLQEIIARQGLPRGWYGELTDRQGRLIVRDGDGAGVTSTERLALSAASRSNLTGWTFAVGMPRDAARADLMRSLSLAGAVVIGLMLLGSALVWWFARDITAAIARLTAGAQALGRGATVEAPRTGMSETDAVGWALYEASLRLRRREEELTRLNETLEQRVAARTRELETATERLAHARKLEAMGRLTGGVAHDFNNLLMVIIGSLDLLRKRPEDDRLLKLVAAAREAADRGADLTRRLLAFGRRQRMEPEPLELNEVVLAAATLLSSSLGPATVVRARTAADRVCVVADRHQLELVIMNLAANAREAMPDGGEVLIEAGREEVVVPAPAARPEAPAPGEYGVLTVTDSGVGIPPDVLAHIWEPFFTTRPHGAGSGLGLAQVLGVVHQLGGGVRVETEVGRGTRVSVYLPATASCGEAAQQVEAPEAITGDLSGCEVLLVDDDADVRAVTADLLRDLGCVVGEANGGAEALARLEAGDAPEILVTDYAMPGMTGAELGRRVGDLRPGVPVLLISGYMDTEALERTWTGPVLAKPFSKEALAARLAVLRRPSPTHG